MKSTTRSDQLTTEEAAEYRAVREQIEQEQPEITARIRRQMAERPGAGNPLLDQHLPSAHEAGDLGALPAPAAEVRELTEDDLLDLVRKARRRIWDETLPRGDRDGAVRGVMSLCVFPDAGVLFAMLVIPGNRAGVPTLAGEGVWRKTVP